MNDYISRKEAIEKIKEEGILGDGYSDTERENDVIKMLNYIPAANVQPVKFGKDVCDLITDRHCEYKCSLCGFEMLEAWCDDDFNYCPNCGAKMEMEE